MVNCPKCGQSYKKNGVWYKRHLLKCVGNAETEPLKDVFSFSDDFFEDDLIPTTPDVTSNWLNDLKNYVGLTKTSNFVILTALPGTC